MLPIQEQYMSIVLIKVVVFIMQAAHPLMTVPIAGTTADTVVLNGEQALNVLLTNIQRNTFLALAVPMPELFLTHGKDLCMPVITI